MLNLDEDNILLNFPLAVNDEDVVGFIIVDSAAILNANSPLSTVLPTREGLLIYKVQQGDTLLQIAFNFGISLDTILWTNPDLKAHFIKPGQEIVILPVSGVLHHVRENDTLESISLIYGVDVNTILKFNKDPNFSNLIIPGASVKREILTPSEKLPDLSGYFVIPTTGWNWGRLHPVNAVDIANACGTPVYAAAEGLVTEEKSYGYNSGYGHYLDIEHPNGTMTRYAHTGENVVSIGDYVLQGDLIAYIGNTGKTHGPTGCHLHFEAHGAKNPFAK